MKALITKTSEPYTEGADMKAERIMIGSRTTIRVMGIPIYVRTIKGTDNVGIRFEGKQSLELVN